MSRIETLLKQFEEIADNPMAQLKEYIKQGRKSIGCFPYYVPEELVHAAGMVPFGIWGAAGTVKAAKEYFPPFYCTIAQMGLELALTGKLNGLSGAIIPSMCDTLRPLTQNFKVAVPEIPMIFLAHPQNRKPDYGVNYTCSQYKEVKRRLEEIAGKAITDDALWKSIEIYNQNRQLRRSFIRLAGQHPEAVTPTQRSAVLKSAFFQLKETHTAMLEELNKELEALPPSKWDGLRILVSGILADNPALLKIFEEHQMAIVADDVAQESRAIRVDAEPCEDPILSLARQFANQDDDTLLYDPDIDARPKHVVKLAKENGAHGVVILMMQFCDPEEMEYPSLKKALDEAGIPSIQIGCDQQMQDFGQARTQLQAFSDMLKMR